MEHLKFNHGSFHPMCYFEKMLSYFVYRDLKGLHDMHKVTIWVVQYTIWSVRTQLDLAEAQETEYEQ